MTTLVNPADLVGPADIARLVHAKVGTVRQWHRRGVLPPPICTVSGVPVWTWPEIAPIVWGRVTSVPETAPVAH